MKLLYGTSDKKIPWYEGFQIYADGSIDIRLSGVNYFEIEKKEQEITWLALFNSKLHELCDYTEYVNESLLDDPYPLTIYEKYVERLWQILRNYCNLQSHAERDFFDMYCELCLDNESPHAFLPALIPHVYINWDSCRQKRDKSKKPYIVDFVFKSPVFGTNNLVIVEVDGQSHYAEFNNNAYHLSEERYAEHLAKDRWLRKQGFKVFRIGNSEIKKITDIPKKEERRKQFYFFFRDVFGEIMYNQGYDSYIL